MDIWNRINSLSVYSVEVMTVTEVINLIKTVKIESAPLPVGPYSQATVACGLVFTAGQIGVVPESGKLAEGISGQMEQALNNLENVLASTGSGLNRILRINLYITDMSDFDIVNRIYSVRFKAPFPARSTVQVAALPLGARIELDAIAIAEEEHP